MTYTHIIKQYPTNDAEILFRASDGMMIGMKEKVTVLFGEDPNKRVSRIFMESEQASAYLRKIASDDAPSGVERIDVRNEEHTIIQPGQVTVMPGTSSIRKIN